GSLSTIHANSAEQALTRLAHCVLTANVGLPHRSVREAIALAIHLVVHIARVESRRVVTEVARIRGYDISNDHFELESVLRRDRFEEACAPGRARLATSAASASCCCSCSAHLAGGRRVGRRHRNRSSPARGAES